MPHQPLVSIVVPAYNAGRFLRASLDSIVSQTYDPKEVVFMDDASTDKTEEIARSYGNRIQYRRQTRNRGQFANVNDGIALARGDYIAVYHADDVYFPEMAARQAAVLDLYPEAGAVFAPEIFIDPEGRETGRLRLPPDVQGGVLLPYSTTLNTVLRYKNRIFPGPGSMVPATVYRAVGPYRGTEYPVAADFEMFLRIARRYAVVILPEHLFCYRWGHVSADQMDRRLRTTVEPYFMIMDEYLASGGRAIARLDALKAHEAHRSEDALMRAVTCYVLERRNDMWLALRDTSIRGVLGSPRVQRYRLSVLYLLLLVLARLPYLGVAERLFRKRWPRRFGPPKTAQNTAEASEC